MKVADLRRALEGVDDSLVVVQADGRDHCLPLIFNAGVVDAENAGHGDYYEYYDDENMFTGSVKVKVFQIG